MVVVKSFVTRQRCVDKLCRSLGSPEFEPATSPDLGLRVTLSPFPPSRPNGSLAEARCTLLVSSILMEAPACQHLNSVRQCHGLNSGFGLSRG
jgi:hypothetical protein